MVTDNVCLVKDNTNTCADDFGFFLVTEQQGLTGLDGILGLSPNYPDNGPSFIGTLFKEGKIPAAVTAFNLSNAFYGATTQSTITFGGYDKTAMIGDMYTHDLDELNT